MPTAGGMDDQPAQRLTDMDLAKRIFDITQKKKANPENWVTKLGQDEHKFLEWLYSKPENE